MKARNVRRAWLALVGSVPVAALAGCMSEAATPELPPSPGGSGAGAAAGAGGTAAGSAGTGAAGFGAGASGGTAGAGAGGTGFVASGGTGTAGAGVGTGGSGIAGSGGMAAGGVSGTGSAGAAGGGAAGSGTAGTAGQPAMKQCAVKNTLTTPLLTDFESYDGTTEATMASFPFNGTTAPLYMGPMTWGNDTGTPSFGMVAGANASMYALGMSNAMATNWGGAMAFWMPCLNATAYAGVKFMAKGTAPTGQIGFVLNMEDTTPPDMLDPAGGGTCIATGVEGECTGPSSTFALTADWTLIQLAWGALTPGVAATGVSVPATGDEITGMTFNMQMVYVEEPVGSGTYVPSPAAFDLQIDDLGFY